MLHRALGQKFQHAGETGGDLPGAQSLFHKLRHALFDAQFAAQTARDSRALRFHASEKIESLLHGGIRTAAGGFLAEANESRADHTLHFGILLDAEPQPDMTQCFAK